MKPMVEYQIGGVLVRFQHDGSHRHILNRIDQADIRLVRGIGWVITRPENYPNIPEIAAVVKDFKKQMVLPLAGFRETP
jgi:hypothetical protein